MGPLLIYLYFLEITLSLLDATGVILNPDKDLLAMALRSVSVIYFVSVHRQEQTGKFDKAIVTGVKGRLFLL
jgi:glycerol uptake facilitator-like aquaporin